MLKLFLKLVFICKLGYSLPNESSSFTSVSPSSSSSNVNCSERKCPPGWVWVDGICDCRFKCDYIMECNKGLMWDIQVCKCVPESPENKVCEPEICAPGHVWSPSYCNCFTACEIIETCDPGYEWDFDRCICLPLISNSSSVMSSSTKTSPSSSSNLSSFSSSLTSSSSSCVPQNCMSQLAYWNQELCRCDWICDYFRTCNSGFEWSFKTCNCVPSNRSSSSNSPLKSSSSISSTAISPSPSESELCNPDPCPGVKCPKGLNLNEARCECTKKMCYTLVPCPTGTIIDLETCICQPCCPVNYVFDPKLKKCVCDIVCAYGLLPDEITCSCYEDPEPSCPPKYLFNHETCQCECAIIAKCFANYIWDPRTCSCQCIKKEICQDGATWNDKECRCVCQKEKICSKNFIFDPKSCDCVCNSTINCKPGFIFDDLKCECVETPQPECPIGYVYSEDKCDCVCEISGVCENREVWDENTCNCFCPEFKCARGFYDELACDCTEVMPRPIGEERPI
jgi:hypothetical protein